MTTTEYALSIGGPIASFVGAWVARCYAKEAKDHREGAAAEAVTVANDAARVDKKHQIVHDLHDCVIHHVKPAPYAGPSSVSFDLPKVLDPEGRTGEVK